MTAAFIPVIRYGDTNHTVVRLNLNYVVSYRADRGGSLIILRGGEFFSVVETPDTIDRLMTEALSDD